MVTKEGKRIHYVQKRKRIELFTKIATTAYICCCSNCDTDVTSVTATTPHSTTTLRSNDDNKTSNTRKIHDHDHHHQKRTSTSSSSSLQTLEKLQQMLHGTDYLSSSSSSSTAPPQPIHINDNQIGTSYRHHRSPYHDTTKVTKRSKQHLSRQQQLHHLPSPLTYSNDEPEYDDENSIYFDDMSSLSSLHGQQQSSVDGIQYENDTLTSPPPPRSVLNYQQSIRNNDDHDNVFQQEKYHEYPQYPQHQQQSAAVNNQIRHFSPSLNHPPSHYNEAIVSTSPNHHHHHHIRQQQSQYYNPDMFQEQQFYAPQQQHQSLHRRRSDLETVTGAVVGKEYQATGFQQPGTTATFPFPSTQSQQEQSFNNKLSSNENIQNGVLKDNTKSSYTSDINREQQVAIIPQSSPILLHDVYYNDRLNQVQSIVEAGSRLTFGSLQKISLYLLAISLLAYAGVSPSTLPLTEYNLQFYDNFRLVCLSTIAPALYVFFVLDTRENDINSVTNTFFVTFFLGYVGIFLIEIVATTIYRLLLFVWLEPTVFSLAPLVPIPVLPWVLRDRHYRPKRITLFAADLGTSCILCPIIEECCKLFLLQRLSKLPINFKWSIKKSSKRKTNRRIAELVNGNNDCINANQYVTQMLLISVALKLADAARRILLYTKKTNANKGFYAVCRGIFPIHELCGAMTSIALAKRDLLGVDIPFWKMLAPAVVVHGMANFRGKKPLFKWNSSSPWSEMQLAPLNIPDSSTFLQLVKKGYAKLMWVITISRVFGYCVKNYYMVNRHALKRTTKYAGNHAAFSAELVTTEMLKNLKK